MEQAQLWQSRHMTKEILNLRLNMILDIIQVIEHDEPGCYTGDGVHINSDIINGLFNEEAKAVVISHLESLGLGQKEVTYRLRDLGVFTSTLLG